MSEHKSTALVTGASSGLGAEFCRQLADRCAVIIAVARRGERLQALTGELAGRAQVHAVEADLTTVEGVARTMEALRQRGPADYLVNNAGFGTVGQFAALPIASQRDMVLLHIDATITLCRAAIPYMRELGGGAIINVSSLGALLPFGGIATYAGSKAFLNTFSLALAQELADTGIAVQALCPGYTRTEFHDVMLAGDFDKGRIPDDMWQQPADVVAASLAALGSDQCLVVPGAGNRALAVEGLRRQLAALEAGDG